MDLNRSELLLINNALNEIINGPDAIDRREFHSRMGGTPEEVEALLRRMKGAIESDQ